jgi:hypothetical protein
MPKEDELFRPYAASSNIIEVINRARTRNLPETVDDDFLRIAGVPELAWSRVMQTLRFLGLVHEDGRPSDTFEALSGAPEDKYRELLSRIIQEAYRIEFKNIDPGQDPQSKIINAFQPYKPRSQTERMVMLFLGLCREAGIPVLDAPRERRMKEAQTIRQRPAGRQEGTKYETHRRTARNFNAHPEDHSIFGITEEDIGVLDEAAYQELWTALGKVVRARAMAKKQEREKKEKEITEGTEEEEQQQSTETP